MAPLKIPLQVSCPNCHIGNLPGSPYCSRCGASLEGVTAAGANVGAAAPSSAGTGDPLARFTAEGQDAGLVQQAHARATEILTAGEVIEYVAVANRGSLTHAPDVAVASNKRILLFRKKVLGKLEQDDFNWRDVRNATIKDGRNGVTLTLDSIQGWQMAVESLPKGQAWRLYELAVEHCEKLAQALRTRSGQFDSAPAAPEVTPIPSPVADLPPSYYAPSALSVPQLPALPSYPPQPQTAAPSFATPPSIPAPEQARPQPTPESVLQAILQQAAQAGGAPTRPMPLSAAAFQAPVADAQPVTFSEPAGNHNTRAMPRLNSLEEIAVFSGPLSGSLPSISESAQHSPYEPRIVDQGTGASGRQSESPGSSYVPEQPTDERPDDANALDFADGPMPLPGSHSSGPLLEAAFEYGGPGYTEDMISGSLETQQLSARRVADLTDRITSTNLAGEKAERVQVAGRSRRSSAVRTPAQSPPVSRQQGSSPAARPSGRADADDPVQKMKQLKAMLDAGLIDHDDYEAKKADILSRL